jgi:hypothetical protein
MHEKTFIKTVCIIKIFVIIYHKKKKKKKKFPLPFKHTYVHFFFFFIGFQSFMKIKEKKKILKTCIRKGTKLSITLSITKIYKP